MTGIFEWAFFLALFQIKHYLADFRFQTGWMVMNKGRYGHPSGLIHAALHSALSVPIFLWAGLSVWQCLTLGAAELVLHYHIDWGKARIVRLQGIDETDPRFWRYLGLDQALHQMTYLGFFALVASALQTD
ncbi:DUF3307 domain-containing protein [uncultured Roseovarius sp.]|uniref:DUF3307 domain-containing protein n=1 Tax=uncultured Roseovarius sp. TaxID=293344 RepID=UPI002623EE5C|nr:DUF3307 domain-containing protein [uncultured Roseovarius sp.]